MKNLERKKRQARLKRHRRVRAKILGTAEIPRFSLYRSNKGLFIQLIDDTSGRTLLSASDKEIKTDKKKKTDIAKETGMLAAEKALKKNISKVVFDKGGYKYHGRVKAAAEGAREKGLKF